MPTYGQYQAQAELRDRRAAQDIVLRERHRQFDLLAQDKTAKFQRFRFSVVGEGSRSANENYLRNYERIFLPSRRPLPPSASSNGAAVTAG